MSGGAAAPTGQQMMQGPGAGAGQGLGVGGGHLPGFQNSPMPMQGQVGQLGGLFGGVGGGMAGVPGMPMNQPMNQLQQQAAANIGQMPMNQFQQQAAANIGQMPMTGGQFLQNIAQGTAQSALGGNQMQQPMLAGNGLIGQPSAQGIGATYTGQLIQPNSGTSSWASATPTGLASLAPQAQPSGLAHYGPQFRNF